MWFDGDDGVVAKKNIPQMMVWSITFMIPAMLLALVFPRSCICAETRSVLIVSAALGHRPLSVALSARELHTRERGNHTEQTEAGFILKP